MKSSSVTLRDILALPALMQAKTEVICGADRLDTPVRWVHVVDTARGAELLNGGELLLTSGIIFDRPPRQQRHLIDSFHRSGAVALLVEVGVQISQVPPAVVHRCQELGLPLIATYDEVKFVEITEAVHSELLHRQFEQVEALQRINSSFWGLMFNGAPPEQLVLHASRELELPVVLEDLNHRVVLYVEGHFLPSQLLSNWEAKSREWADSTRGAGLVADPVSVPDPHEPGVSWDFIDIQAQGNHWGRLFVRRTGERDSKATHIMRHASMSLAIERLSAHSPNSWIDLRERMGLDRLLHHRFTTVTGQKTVLESNGFRTDGRRVIALEVRSATEGEPTLDQVRGALLRIGPDTDVLVAPQESDATRIVGAVSVDPHRYQVGELKRRMLAEFEALGVALNVTVAVGLEGPIDLGAALHQLAKIDEELPATGVNFRVMTREKLEGVLHKLHDDVNVQAFSESLLTPLLLHDQRNTGDLLPTARAIVDYPTSRSAAAQVLHLSRTALYSRISTIERLLSMDLNNGKEFFALSLAVRAYFGE